MSTHRLVGTATALVAIFAVGSFVAPVASATTGSLVVTANMTLTEDHVGTIMFGANSVTLDCAGHSVTSTPVEAGTGVGIAAFSRSGITVRNCRVAGFAHGISFANVTNFNVSDNTSSDNEKLGIALAAAHGTVSGNTVSDNAWYGIGIGGGGFESSDVRFVGNTAAHNGIYGFVTFLPYPFSHYQTGFVFAHNVSIGNGDSGFVIGNGNDSVTLTGNRAAENVSNGFWLYGADGAVVTGNYASDNGYSGFSFSYSASHTFTNNTATDNSGDGYFFYQVTNSMFAHNVATHNHFGVALWASSGINLAHNVANNNARGFVFDLNSTGNILSQDVANSNTLTGFRFYPGSTGNTIADCIGHANGAPDAVEQNQIGENTWIHNNFGSMWTP